MKIKVETAYSESSCGGNEADNQLLYNHFDYGDSCNDNDVDYEACKEEKHDLSDYEVLKEDIIAAKKKKRKKMKRFLSKVQNEKDIVVRKFKRNQEKKIDGLYHCKFCNYSNKRLNSVKVHRMIHTGERPFLCDVCSATFRQKEHLIKHKKTHIGIKCERSARGSEIYDREKSFVCSKCGYICRTKVTLDKHEKKCFNSVLKCSTCDETFFTRNELIRHRAIHVELRSYDCELCDFTTGNLLYLKKHTLKHSKMLYLCYVCSFTTVHKSTMQEHRLTHNEKRDQNNVQTIRAMEGCNYKSRETQQYLDSKNDQEKITYNYSIQVRFLIKIRLVLIY